MELTLMKGSGGEGKWWRRDVVTMGSGEEEVVRKGSGDKGSGEEGKWWWRGVVTKGSGEEGKWWRREVVTKGSGGREVVKKGSDDEGEWWVEGKWWKWLQGRKGVRREVFLWVLCVSWSCGCRSHWNGCMNVVCCGEEGKWFFREWLQPAMKGTSCVRRVRLGSFGSFYVFCNNGGDRREVVRSKGSCMPCVVGRKPEQETLCFSV